MNCAVLEPRVVVPNCVTRPQHRHALRPVKVLFVGATGFGSATERHCKSVLGVIRMQLEFCLTEMLFHFLHSKLHSWTMEVFPEG